MIKHLHDSCLFDNLDNLVHDLNDQEPEDWVQLETEMKTLFSRHLFKAPTSVLATVATLENPCQQFGEQE